MNADRRTLLVGTALASTLLLAAPTRAHAVFDCIVGPPAAPASPGPISNLNVGDAVICVNTEARTNAAGNAIELRTFDATEYIDITNSGTLSATNAAGLANGIYAVTSGSDAPVSIVNDGDISAAAGALAARGIFAVTQAAGSSIDIVNSGDMVITGSGAGAVATGIQALAIGSGSVRVDNSGDFRINGTGAYLAGGIFAFSQAPGAPIVVTNTGDMEVTSANSSAYGLYARAYRQTSDAVIDNTGDLSVTGERATAIFGRNIESGSSVSIDNRGDITSIGTYRAVGIAAATIALGSSTSTINHGDITARSSLGVASGIYSTSVASSVSIENSGDIAADGSIQATGVFARTTNGSIDILNSGDIEASTDTTFAVGLFAQVYGGEGSVAIENSGDIEVESRGDYAGGIVGLTSVANSGIVITNSGDVTASKGSLITAGVHTQTFGENSGIVIENSGRLAAYSSGNAFGVSARAYGSGSPISIVNSGSIYGASAGIFGVSPSGATIINTGYISAGSHRAIDVKGAGTAEIYNRGKITGSVDLTDQDDVFINQNGGVFETKLTSFFRGGDDIFRNEGGGVVRGASNRRLRETSAFEGLERFDNQGLITMQDGAEGDAFRISNTPGGTDLKFKGSGNSTLAVDAFLGAPGSQSDTFTIEGDVSGRTKVTVNNTSSGPGALNTVGIPVVFATGKTPDEDDFFLPEPIDAGFFTYDLFFEPTGSGQWELRSFAGGGAHLLPQLITAAQDIWHQGSSVWFDRTADLRVLLNGGAGPSTFSGKSLGAPPIDNFTPAVWARGSGSWLDRDDSATTSAFGRNFRFDLDRDLQTLDFQMGLDLGTRDLLSYGDILVFGFLGGFVHADLDYDGIARNFDYDGGQVGAYATYMRGGLFVDTLLNVHLYELDANGALGFPDSVDANTVGLRTDTGYRFGSFTGGPFLEPLATIEVLWADIDGFSLGGNTVSFDDDANVRGRLGLRAGTTMEAWQGTLMEPFVVGSLWGNLTDDNQATLTSSGTTFRFQDDLDDVWGEVSAGVNFFNPSANTAVFAKIDVTFGDDVSGVGGKAGMRVAW